MSEGTLYVVATPIGHLGDITLRAGDILRRVDMVAAEDTRRSRALLTHIEAFPKPLVSCNEQNEGARVREILAKLDGGGSVALISDAGTPLVSDPGHRLVRAVFEAGHKVVPIPGASALVAALSVCPLASERFVFEGFLPNRGEARRKRIRALASMGLSVALFEAPHRLLATLDDLVQIMGDRRVMVARELTKVYERVHCGSLTEIREHFAGEAPRGELVLVVERAQKQAAQALSNAAENLLQVLLSELSPSQSARLVAAATGESRGATYRRALELSKSNSS